MEPQLVIFTLLAAVGLGSAVMVITRKNPVHSALYLVVTFFSVAGIYVVMGAAFLAAVQVLVYAGGIMVLFLFVIMLVNLDEQAKERQFNGQWWIALACVAVVGAQVFFFIQKGSAAFQLAKPADTTPTAGNTEMIADALFSEYLLPFEIASLLLLVAVVGSVVMAKKRI